MTLELQKLIISHSSLQLTMIVSRDTFFFMQISDGMREIHSLQKGYLGL